MGPTSHILPDGKRLHLQHGPIDLIITADGEREIAFDAALQRFSTILTELVDELALLRTPLRLDHTVPQGPTARRMHAAASTLRGYGYLTSMAAVAGAVADEVLSAMRQAAHLTRAYVNNGGDIAIYLSGSETFKTMMSDHQGRPLGQITLTAADGVGGIATSGRHGRSHSLGIADSVTVLAANAATADVAATLVANSVDLPGHPVITRQNASLLDETSDLGDLPVVTGCRALSTSDCDAALSAGYARALSFVRAGLIKDAALFLQGQSKLTPSHAISLTQQEAAYA